MADKKTVENKDAEAMPFEEALEMVEQIIERIESGQIGLEDSIQAYERGVKLIKRCRNVLDLAELRVRDITEQLNSDEQASASQ